MNVNFIKIDSLNTDYPKYIGQFFTKNHAVLFVLIFNSLQDKVHYSISDITTLKKKKRMNYSTKESLKNNFDEFIPIEKKYYKYKHRNNDLLKSISTILTEVEDEISRFFSKKNNLISETILMEDRLITISGVEKRIQIDSIGKDSISYHVYLNRIKKNNSVSKKTIYLIQQNIKDPIILSHKHAKKDGDFDILDANGIFIDLLVGYSSFSFDKRNFDEYTGNYYYLPSKTSSLSLSGRIGYKYFFSNEKDYYSHALSASFQENIPFSKTITHISSFFIGYISMFKTKKNKTLELTNNIGLSRVSYPTPSYIYSLNSIKPGISFNPSLKYGVKHLTVGVEYLFLLGIDLYESDYLQKLQSHSFFISIGYRF